jgi:adenine-specific DNA methylase
LLQQQNLLGIDVGLRQLKWRMPEAMDERDFFNETTEQRTHTLTCPKCGQAAEYKVTWVVRRKKPQLPRNADERDRARFAKAQSYMVRRDDKLSCANVRCRKPFEISTLQSLAFLMD